MWNSTDFRRLNWVLLFLIHLELKQQIMTLIHSRSSLENHNRFQTKMGKFWGRNVGGNFYLRELIFADRWKNRKKRKNQNPQKFFAARVCWVA